VVVIEVPGGKPQHQRNARARELPSSTLARLEESFGTFGYDY
jgi:hypothetical protein